MKLSVLVTFIYCKLTLNQIILGAEEIVQQVKCFEAGSGPLPDVYPTSILILDLQLLKCLVMKVDCCHLVMKF